MRRSSWEARAAASRSLFVGLILLILASFVPFAAATPTARAVVPLRSTPCPAPAQVEGLRVDCATLTVPESRRDYTGKTIDLAVAILRSPNPAKASDPVVFLQGGPGGATLPLAQYVAGAYAPTLAQRDIILMDQRGTGYSRPSLNCGADIVGARKGPQARQAEDLPDFIQAQVGLFATCLQRYRAAGVDLSAYNSVENAADFEDLRLALGAGPWNVVGASYGSRLALTMLRYRPETLRSVVLESAYPLQANFHVDVFASYNNALTTLSAQCAADAACNAAYPDLAGTFERLYASLNANPVQVPVVNLQTGELITYLPITGVDVSYVMFQLGYVTEIIPLLPAFIGETAKGNLELLSLLVSALLTSPTGTDVPVQAIGMFFAVQCNEDATFAAPSDFVRSRDQNRRASALAFFAQFNEGVLNVCSAAGLGQPEAAENQPVTGDRPVMIVSGTNDPVTPPSYAAQAAASLSNSFVVSYPRGGHTPSLSSPCLANAVAAFIGNPAQRPDTSCVVAETRPFVVPSAVSAQSLDRFGQRAARALRFQLP